MRVGNVIGSVTLGSIHPLLAGGQFKLVVPFAEQDFESYCGESEELVLYDELNAGPGEWIAISEGAEAAMPFFPKEKPVDAYNAGILDTVEIDAAALQRF